MKKIYKLTIYFDTEDEECEALSETVDVVNEEEELTVSDYADKNLRDILIRSGIMGDAWESI